MGRGARHFRDVGCDHGAVVNIEEPKIIPMIQISLYLTNAVVFCESITCYIGERRSHALVDDADLIIIELPIT